MAIATIQETIDRGKLSIGYAANDNSKGALFGARLNSPKSPVTLAMVTDALEWARDGGATSDDENREIANYLIWLCGKYGMQAQFTLGDTSGGGSLTPGGGSTLLNPIDWEVGATADTNAPLADQESTVTLDGTNGMFDLRGYNIQFARGGVTQYTTPPPDGVSTYYSWNRTTAVLTLLNGAAQLTEQMRIYPSK
jgi:hypothetical protein